MLCPFKLANSTDHPGPKKVWASCESQECALWNERFGKCSLAVDAYLKGQEDHRKEREMLRKEMA